MKKHRIIINADDLGMSGEVNAAIEKAITAGCISSSTIMANAPAFEDAIRIAKLYPHISFGVHLNIDEFKPLTDTSVFMKYGMLDTDGAFKKEYLHNTDISFNDDLLDAIYKEWKAQVKKVIDAGVIPSHFDSHEHTHGIFELQPMYIKLLKGYCVKRTRRQPYSSMLGMVAVKFMHLNKQVKSDIKPLSSEGLQPKKRHSFIYRRLQQFLHSYRHRRWIHDLKEEDFVMTDYFDSYQKFCLCYPKLLKYCRIGTVELMTHPGHKGYLSEGEMLMNKELQKVCPYELINYNQL